VDGARTPAGHCRATLRREPKRHSVNARRSAIHGTSAKVTANDYRWSVEKMVAAHPQGGKNVERS
jgi:hypothetical protein